MGNGMSQPVSINHAQMSQLRAAPNGGFVLGGRAPSQASRIEMLPPRQSEHDRAIAVVDFPIVGGGEQCYRMLKGTDQRFERTL